MASKKQLNSDKSVSRHLDRPPQKIASSKVDRTIPPQKIAYTVVHSIAGRIRFRIPRLAKDSDYAERLKLAIESDPRTTSVRIKPTAASIVITYQKGELSDKQMRSHLVNLIQTAPNMVLPTPVTTRSILETIFDALINLIEGARKLARARNAMVHRQFGTDTWERLLKSAKTGIKGLKATVMFILPRKRSPKTSNQSGLQPMSIDNNINNIVST